MVESGEIVLNENTVSLLKRWNAEYETVLYDSKFLKELLKDVFGLLCLSMSSVGGTPARNKDVKHDRLDQVKLKFIRGKYLRFFFWDHVRCRLFIYLFLSQIYSTVALEWTRIGCQDSTN